MKVSDTTLNHGGPRSAGSIPQQRIPRAWPKDRRFRILSLDGGGIRGIFSASVLSELERRFCAGRRVSEYFDLIAGTSTGGIIALGLGAGLSAAEMNTLYVERGQEIFPPRNQSWLYGAASFLRQTVLYRYDRDAIAGILSETLGERLFGESANRLCIPAFDGTHSEVFVYKTPHHADYKFDRFEKMINIGLATSAAPTFFQPFKNGVYQLVDGGVWANNPLMLAVIEALICFDVAPAQIDVLSIGCGDDPYSVSPRQIKFGGILFWRDVIFAAMRLQSLAATNQARLLLGPPSVVRLSPPVYAPPIDLDDWCRAVELLPSDAVNVTDAYADQIKSMFFGNAAEAFVPVPAAEP
ncbi:CBASS cGAMP-activated phospholipase [Oceaniovalibus sp. ACAM 378]|uniref:CBASS cGAMP-activated phospholipase n=1 Tax=Oceaniovalibus sp. ACAM 378 TaxID=2599923 RepID=UPI0011D91220|nr:CBASS cGAMP-activated phospholipase [Oceaniovalibus sp. ACAM 378]TYB83591.1 patatin-like phospholipase family protein [Oceaniovalibus sp. ACAM 378]